MSTFHLRSFLIRLPADVIAVLTELVIKLSGGFRRFLIMSPEVVLNLSRTRQQAVHQSGVEQITIADAVFNDAAMSTSLLKEIGKDVFSTRSVRSQETSSQLSSWNTSKSKFVV